MKDKIKFILVLFFLMNSCFLFAQDKVTIVSSVSENAEGLDLQVVSEMFKDTEDLETFEKMLNDSEIGVNNLDLDKNGEVDFIRVVEEVADNKHIIILQVPIGEDDFQDVATIEVEKTDDESYSMYVQGNEYLYGPDYYIEPVTVVSIQTWPIVTRIYRPGYRPYRSKYYWNNYPRWWHKYQAVKSSRYEKCILKYKNRRTFKLIRKSKTQRLYKIKNKHKRSVKTKKRESAEYKSEQNKGLRSQKVKKSQL